MSSEPRQHEGYIGYFTRDQAEGAIPNGSRVVKVWGEPGDGHPIGATATVLGSLGDPSFPEYGYFVEWDSHPRMAVFVRGKKIALQQ
jgi:hypothetical protein